MIGWFEVQEEGCCRKESFPVGIAQSELGEFYWFPVFELPGMKIGKFYHLGEPVKDPSKLSRTITAADEQVSHSPFLSSCIWQRAFLSSSVSWPSAYTAGSSLMHQKSPRQVSLKQRICTYWPDAMSHLPIATSMTSETAKSGTRHL